MLFKLLYLIKIYKKLNYRNIKSDTICDLCDS